MGGAQAGEVASQIAVEAFEQGLPEPGSPRSGWPSASGRPTAASTSARGPSRSAPGWAPRSPPPISMTPTWRSPMSATAARTCSATVRSPRLTQDHSLVDELVRRGKLTEEQAAEHPQRSIITRALGPEPEVEVDTWSYPARAGDVLLLCSDGLTSMISEERDRRDPRARVRARAGRRRADRRGQRGRRPRQHHRRPVRAWRRSGLGSDDEPTMVGVPAPRRRHHATRAAPTGARDGRHRPRGAPPTAPARRRPASTRARRAGAQGRPRADRAPSPRRPRHAKPLAALVAT